MTIENNFGYYHRVGLIALAIVLALGLFLRVYDLEADPPNNIGRSSQDLTTDPHHLTSFAASAAKFGESEPFPYPKWQVFKVSLVSAMAYLLFKAGETNRVYANLAGAIPAFAGIILFVWGLMIGGRKQYYPALIAATFLSFNFLLITYNRAPFLESGLIFYLGLIFFLFQKYRFNKFNLRLLALLVSLSCLTGKIFGVTIGAAIFMMILTSDEKRCTQKAIGFVVAGIISAGLIVIVLYSNRFPDYLAYLNEHSVSAHGSLYILEGIRYFISRLLTYGTQTKLFRDSPFLTLGLYAALAYTILYARNYFSEFHKNTTLRFSIYWMIALFLILMPVNYRPLRYGILMLLPMALIITESMRLSPDKRHKAPRWISFLTLISLFYLNWFFAFHLVTDIFYFESYKTAAWRIITYTFAPVLVLTAIMVWPRISLALLSQTKRLSMFFGILALASIFYQGARYLDWASESRYSLRDASVDLGEILGPDAVLTGPYAPTLTIDNELNHFIYAFGLQKPDFNIFDRFPITHLAVDQTNFALAVKDYPDLKRVISVTDYFLRNRSVIIARIAPHDSTFRYEPTDCERTMHLLGDGEFEKALMYCERFLRKHPGNRSALLQKCTILGHLSQFEELIPLLFRVRDDFPGDYTAQFLCASSLKKIGLHLDRTDLLEEADATIKHVLKLTDKDEFVQGKYDEIM